MSLSTNRLIDSSKLRVELTVLDRGIGIPSHEVDQVFDLLWCSKDVTHRRLNPDGQGIGLYVSRRICQSIGGDIELSTVNKRGSCFKIIFPTELIILQPTRHVYERKESTKSPGMRPQENSVILKGANFNLNAPAGCSTFATNMGQNLSRFIAFLG